MGQVSKMNSFWTQSKEFFKTSVVKTPISTEAECSWISGRLVWVLCYLALSVSQRSFSFYVQLILNNHALVVLLPLRQLRRKDPGQNWLVPETVVHSKRT